MRPFEIALVSIDVLLLLFAPRWPRARRWLSLAAIAVLGAHVVVEGARWQMSPAYVLTVIIVGWALLVPGQRKSGLLGIFGRIIALLILLLSTAAALAFPIIDLPALTGPYPVGTATFYAADTSRNEIYGADPTAPREIMLQVWYPASADSDAPAAPYIDNLDLAATGLAQTMGLPGFILSHINLIDSGLLNEPMAASTDAPYPLLVFSHGWSGFRNQTTFLMRELASHGYVVASVDHPYDAAFVVFPDGRAVYNDPAVLGIGLDDALFDQTSNLLVRTRSTDLGFAIDELGRLAEGRSVLNGLIDFGRIGVFGHSTGGGTVMEFCATDDRCTAALGLDTWAEPVSDTIIAQGLSQPLFMQFSQQWPSANNAARAQQLLDNSSNASTVMTIMDTAHWDFTDTPLLTPLAATLGLKGPLDGERTMDIINAYSVAFFDHYLKNIDTDLLVGDSAEYPEVQFDTIQANER